MFKGLNVHGVYGFCRAILHDKGLLLPQISVQNINEINFQSLKNKGFHGVIFDKDNTLTIPHGRTLAPHVTVRSCPLRLHHHISHQHSPYDQLPVQNCKAIFGEENVLVFSNSVGSIDDVNFQEADLLEKELQVRILRHGMKKPKGIEKIQEYYGPHIPLQSLIIIGDRYSTDILFGNLYGLCTIHIEQFASSEEHSLNRILQLIEKFIIKNLKLVGIQSKQHPYL